MTSPLHTPVLTAEVLRLLDPHPGEVFIDCTAGRGSHASLIASRLSAAGTVILNDADPGNLAAAAALVRSVNPQVAVTTLQGNFADLPRRLAESGQMGDCLLADLGFSSNQVETAERGFSFQRDGPLDMRMDPSTSLTAADLVASASESELTRILREFGEEPAATRIARKLVESRRVQPISTTRQLADIVRSVLPRKGGPTDPATKTFQAIRIAVNDEIGSLGALLAGIERSSKWLKPRARVAIISFHSLEDRLVKHTFASMVAAGRAEFIARGTVEASPDELASNPRSRSAKLRAIRLSLHAG